MVESGRVLGKGRIRPTIEKLSGRVSEKVETVRVPENGRSGRAPGKGRIRATIEKLSGRVSKRVESVRVPENGRIRESTRKR